jgi:glucose/arabinose dehydrogenase
LEVPWGLAFLPSGSALVSERDSHRIVRVDQRGRVSEVGVVPGVADDAGEGGLLGIVLSPSFAQDAVVYAYLTSPTDNRVVRMTYRDGRLSMPSVVFADIPKAAVHNGGRIVFGRDDLLYVTTGDAGERLGAPDPRYLGGKVLRMTKDGEPAPGNPIGSSLSSAGRGAVPAARVCRRPRRGQGRCPAGGCASLDPGCGRRASAAAGSSGRVGCCLS